MHFFSLDFSDFSPTETTLTFDELNLNQTVRVPIVDDEINEDTETFFASLSLTSDVDINLNPAETSIFLLDNDRIGM